MPRNCVINLDHSQTVSRGRILPLIANLRTEKMVLLCWALLFALGFRED